MNTSASISIVGGGLAGALLATLLAQRGYSVEILERRGDPREKGYEGGRSINLALAERGMHALRLAGLETEVLAQAVMMRGRMVHFHDGRTELQPYGQNDAEVIWSVHRGRLNITLLDAAEKAGAKITFNARVHHINFEQRSIQLMNDQSNQQSTHNFAVLIGADGAGSMVRQAMASHIHLNERFEPLGHSYKELEIPPSASGDYQIEPNALHIWPRGGYMCIALPNTERTFTVTLFLPSEGPLSFASMPTLEQAMKFFESDFADAVPLMPDLRKDWQAHPASALGTLYIDNWHYADKAVLIGDAAHAMVPFHGQGMNCAFEDCVAFCAALDGVSKVKHINWQHVFEAFEYSRRANALAIQTMAIENYTEMRDRVDDDDYRLQRQLELELAKRHPTRFIPRYSMVSFNRTPYAIALERGKIQRALLIECTRGLNQFAQINLQNADNLVLNRLTVLSD